MNLVGPGPVDVHYDDAHAALAGVRPAGRWVDLGTGAGFPGIVLAAQAPEARVELVDSRRKRCTFLEEAVALSGATGIDVRNERVEVLDAGVYDGVTARAFAAPEVVVAEARRLLKPGGVVVLFLQDDGPLPPHPGFEVAGETPYSVAGLRRRSVTLRKLS